MKRFINGQKYEQGFNYNGMLKFGLKVKDSDNLEKLEKLAYTFNDVNYHTIGAPLNRAVTKLINNDKNIRTEINLFKALIREELAVQDKCSKITSILIDNLEYLQFNGSIFALYNNVTRCLQQPLDKDNQIIDIELMKFFVVHYIGEEILTADTKINALGQPYFYVTY